MGNFNEYCSIRNISISEGDKIALIPIISKEYCKSNINQKERCSFLNQLLYP